MVLHGYLYAAGFDDRQYQISGKVDPMALKIEAIEIVKLPYSLTDDSKIKCAEGAGRSVKALLEAQQFGTSTNSAPIGPYTVEIPTLLDSYTWLAAPLDGFGYYIVTGKSADGWECVYYVEMGIGNKDSLWPCELRKTYFDTCAR